MLSQLKTVLIKEKIKLSFFRLVGASAFVGSITCSKWPETTSTVKMRLRVAGLLDRVAKKSHISDWPIKRLRCAKEHWTGELCLEGHYPGVDSSLFTLRLVFCGVLFNKAAS
jgi:hypothetical protein